MERLKALRSLSIQLVCVRAVRLTTRDGESVRAVRLTTSNGDSVAISV
jgi:hypothetical protein